MIPVGRMYHCVFPSVSRSLAADEVILNLVAPSDAVLLILSAYFSVRGTDDLNEPNSIEWVRTSSDGTGGGSPTFEVGEVGDPAPGATATAIDADGWTAAPTVTDFWAGGGFNLAAGWEWSYAAAGRPMVISPSGRIGFRITDALSAAMNIEAGINFLEVGG